jgi:alanyl-tRNA synthetase
MTSWWCTNSSYICNGYLQRVMDVPGVSVELCGGTHVANTAEIGLFKIVSESGVAAGIRRIEAVAGPAVLAYLNERDAVVRQLGERFKAQPAEIVERLKALVEERKALQTEVANLRRDLAMGGKSGGPEAKEINGVKLIAQVMTGVSGKDLPSLIDEMKARIGSGAVVLIADTGAKPAVAAGVTADLTDRISAVTLAKAAVEALGGKGGGGRPDMAQGGGADIALADAALKAVEAALEA